MKRTLDFLSALVLGLIFASVSSSGTAPPNIVVFLCDDLGLLDSTPYGATDVRTPNLQRLADAGLKFNRAFVASPACAPSRGAMLCGLMPSRNGAEPNHSYARPEIRGWPHYLRELGYDTAAFGKVAHGKDVKRWGFSHFDLKFDLNLVRDYVTGRSSDKPLCLFVGTHDPHVPWTKNTDYDPRAVKLPWNFVDTPETRELRTDYYTEVSRADTDMGTLYDFVRQKLGTNTLFLFSSDHGAQWPFGKWNLYDTSIRTPLLAAWPGVIQPGAQTDAMVSSVDFTPTLIELAGGTPPPGLDGRSFAKLLLGRTNTHRDEIYTTHSGDGNMNVYPIRAVRTEQFKYIRNLFPQYEHTTHIDRAQNADGLKYWLTWVAMGKTNPNAAAIVHRYHERPAEELYDIVNDPDEKQNLATNPESATTLTVLRGKVDAWMKSQEDSARLFNTPYPLGTPELAAPTAAVPPAPAKGKRKQANKQGVMNRVGGVWPKTLFLGSSSLSSSKMFSKSRTTTRTTTRMKFETVVPGRTLTGIVVRLLCLAVLLAAASASAANASRPNIWAAPPASFVLAVVGVLMGGGMISSAAEDPGVSGGREIVDFDLGWRFAKGEITEAETPGFDDTKWREVTLPHDWSIEDLEPLPPAEPVLSVTKGTWRFSRRDNLAWKEPRFDDSGWLETALPGAWDEYAEYKENKTYGWLRREFSIPGALRGRDFLLATGWVKDADETFVNGVKVGATGGFPPEFRGEETTDRYYRIPADLVKGDGTDVVAVRVYREAGWGCGIVYEQMPHTRSGPFDTKAVNGSAIGYTVGGTGWYRKSFTVPTGREGDRVRIQFDGVYQDADVWINGHHLGNHPYGYTSFGYDLTPHLDFGGVNVMAVRARNLDENSRWYSGSGIYRQVQLIFTEPVHVDQWGTFVTTPEVSDESAQVRVRNKVVGAKAGTVVRIRIKDAAGKVFAAAESCSCGKDGAFHLFDQQLKLANPSRWSLETPHLYTATCDVIISGKVVDSVNERFGIRTITMNAKDGFQLNGKSLLLKGTCMHHDNGPLGAAAYDDAEYRRVRLTKEAGFNAIRCAHNPPSDAFLDACDELGMLVIDEAFDIWKHGKGGSSFYAKHFDEWWRRDLEAMILRDRNHPSVIMWSTGNEIPQNDTEPVAETAGMLADYVRKLDPTRPVTSGVQGVNPKKDGFFDTLDVSGYNYAFAWNEGHTYETNAYVDDHKRHPDRIIYGAESFSSRAFDYWMAAVDHPWMLGDFVWTGWDYLGESSIGWIGFSYPVYWPVAYCGDISVSGVRQPQSYYRGALFGDDTVAAFVQSPEPSFPHIRRYEWGSPDVLASWTWPGMEGKPLVVHVYVPFEMVDAKGTVDPRAANLVHFKISGPAVIAAVGNADPADLGSFQQPRRKAWRGRGLVILRSTGKPGRVELTVASDGLEPATAGITAK